MKTMKELQVAIERLVDRYRHLAATLPAVESRRALDVVDRALAAMKQAESAPGPATLSRADVALQGHRNSWMIWPRSGKGSNSLARPESVATAYFSARAVSGNA